MTALGPGDMFVTRFGANLAPIWAQRYGGNTGSAETLHDVAVDTKGNAVATGEVIASVDFGTGALNPVGTGQDPFLVKIDPTGKTVWAKRFTTTSQATNVGAAVATAPDNDVVAAGAFMADITIGGTTPHTSVGGNGFTQSPDGYIARFAA